MSIFKYYTKRYADCDCFIVEFDPSIIRFDVSIGKENKLEKLSTMTGDTKDNEFAIVKLNGGFFNMDGSSEFIGTFMDENRVFNVPEFYYPTAILWKNLQMTIEFDQNKLRMNTYKDEAYWAIGCPWSIIVDGKYDYHYSKQFLSNAFIHPFTKQPRSMMGQRLDGTIVLVAVDGRSKTSVGMTVDTCGELMLSLNCHNAVNLDGGGSTELICYDAIKNNISTGAERYIGTAIFAYLDVSKNMYGVSTAASLNIRCENNTSSEILTQIKNGEEVKIIGYNKGWYNILYKDIVGWCSCNYINITRYQSSNIKKTQNTNEISFNDLISQGYKSIDL